jgi:hypothetical protein
MGSPPPVGGFNGREQRRMLNDLRRKEDDVPDAAEMVRRLIERAVKQ